MTAVFVALALVLAAAFFALALARAAGREHEDLSRHFDEPADRPRHRRDESGEDAGTADGKNSGPPP